MTKKEKKYISHVSMLTVLILVNGIAFSGRCPGGSLFGFTDPVKLAWVAALLFCDIALIGYVSYGCFCESGRAELKGQVSDNPEDYFALLYAMPNEVYLSEQADIYNRIVSFDRNTEQLKTLIMRTFQGRDITKARYTVAIANLRKVFYTTVANALNRMRVDTGEMEAERVCELIKLLHTYDDLAMRLVQELTSDK